MYEYEQQILVKNFMYIEHEQQVQYLIQIQILIIYMLGMHQIQITEHQL